MKYWEDFQSKFGFGDGDAVPPDAWHVRYVYVRELNRLAKANGSSVRAYASDRDGMHNPLLILRADASAVDDREEAVVCGGSLDFLGTEPEEDAAYQDAVTELEDTDVDDLVEIGEIRMLNRKAKPL
jgi:hypothetical protein